ncbi:MAG: glycosyltransferase family 39 protein [Patescibacteria group bacterium]
MINSAKLIEFLKKNYIGLFLIGLIFFIVIFSAATLTTKPRFWVDEAFTVELAHNFLKFGELDVRVGPDQFSGIPYLIQSTGYPLTVSLAAVFSFFGFDLAIARIFMLALMAVFLIALFLFGKKLFGAGNAILSLLLIATFSSFYASGRTAVGEIPGFILLIAGIYFWLIKDKYFWSGLFLGLAVVAKPSVFLLVLPTVIFTLLLEREDLLKRILKIGLGIAPTIVVWILLVLEHPFLKTTWVEIVNFYKNPYGGEVASNITANLSGFFYSTTLIYFGALFFIVILGRYWSKERKQISFYNFVIFYGIIAFAYYLRSPGWLRYILIAEFLILFALPQALTDIFSRFKEFISKANITGGQLTVIAVSLLVSVQIVNLFTGAQIYYSDSAIKAASFINKEFPEKSVWVTDSFETSVLLETDKKYQTVKVTGIALIGNELVLDNYSPEVVVSLNNKDFTQSEKAILDNNYDIFNNNAGYEIYTLR